MRERRVGAFKIHSGIAFTAGIAFADLAADAEKGVVLNEASQLPQAPRAEGASWC
jgi:hypothetical protein